MAKHKHLALHVSIYAPLLHLGLSMSLPDQGTYQSSMFLGFILVSEHLVYQVVDLGQRKPEAHNLIGQRATS